MHWVSTRYMRMSIWSLMRRQETSYIAVLRTSKYDVLRISQLYILRRSTWSCMQQQGTSLTDVLWTCPATVTNLVPQYLLAQHIDSDQYLLESILNISMYWEHSSTIASKLFQRRPAGFFNKKQDCVEYLQSFGSDLQDSSTVTCTVFQQRRVKLMTKGW